jgi:hypothetical protein
MPMLAQSQAIATVKPFNAAIVSIAKMSRSGDALWVRWVAEPGDEPVLFAAFDPARLTHKLVERIIGRQYGAPTEIVEGAL